MPHTTHTHTPRLTAITSTALIPKTIYANMITNTCTLQRHVLESSVWIEDKKAKLQIIIMFAEVDR